ncbi:MAG: class I SAM-dependent methyltransferase [Magnetococcales bacterium]|nr:class I SAM-dependent methyltransferase [Magnetococcales bacterium]
MEKGLLAGNSTAEVALQLRISDTLLVPRYLEQTYWWAYLHPKGVRFFERQWLVNLILWGNFARLRDAALREMGETIAGRTLQVACVYGDFTPRVVERLAPEARLDVVDVAPVQLENVKRKLKPGSNVHLHHQDSTELAFPDGTFDHVVVFFLLHEQPEEVRVKSIHEAMRVVRPGGRVIFVDYHRPSLFNPFRYIMTPILRILEPFAQDLWRREIVSWVGEGLLEGFHKETFFAGLYQKVVLRRAVAQDDGGILPASGR